MTSIFPSSSAFRAANTANKEQANAHDLMERLSSGKRITNGSDDAADLYKTNNIKAKILSTKASIRNVTDLMSTTQIIEQGYKNINAMLLRANELTVQATNKIYKDSDRISINNEIQNIIDEIDNKYLVVSERNNTCSFWKFYETFNDYLDTFSKVLLDCNRYLYISSHYSPVIQMVVEEVNEETGETNPNLIYSDSDCDSPSDSENIPDTEESKKED